MTDPQSAIRNPQSNGLALFGGTFNPVHNGHIEAAQKAVAALHLSELIFIPTYIPPHKSTAGLIPSRQRMCMLERAVQGEERLSWSDTELSRKGTSYTIDTVRYYKKQYPDNLLYFLTGSDSLSCLHTWKDIGPLVNECILVIIARPGFPINISQELSKTIPPQAIESLMKNSLKIATPDISSTQIREAVKNREDISSFVPASVKEYIEEHGLYR